MNYLCPHGEGGGGGWARPSIYVDNSPFSLCTATLSLHVEPSVIYSSLEELHIAQWGHFGMQTLTFAICIGVQSGVQRLNPEVHWIGNKSAAPAHPHIAFKDWLWKHIRKLTVKCVQCVRVSTLLSGYPRVILCTSGPRTEGIPGEQKVYS